MNRDVALDALPQELSLGLLDAAGEGIALIDAEHPDQLVLWLNPALEHLSGFDRHELIGSNLGILHAADSDQRGLAEVREAITAGRTCDALLRSYRPDGALYWSQLRVAPFRDAGGRLWSFAFLADVSARREMEIMLGRQTDEIDSAQRRLEEVDPVDRLTGLQNEHSFRQSLELAWFSCARDRRALTLFLFAPDYFDVYLETFGRIAGDSALRMVARAVSAAFRRASDVSARLDGAVFAALGVDMQRDMLESHAQRVSGRVRALAIRNPHAPLARDLSLSAAVLQVRPNRSPDWRGFLGEARETLLRAQSTGIEQLVLQDYGSEPD